METLKDIFVSYEIAQKLKEIGFDEECMGYYMEYDGELYLDIEYLDFFEYCSTNINNIYITNHNRYGNQISAPTWEQVKKWFREKNYQSNVVFNFGSFYGYIEHTREAEAFATDEDYTSYEQAREQLILKLIEIYENGKWKIE